MAAPMKQVMLVTTKNYALPLRSFCILNKAYYCSRNKTGKGSDQFSKKEKSLRTDKDGYRILESVIVPPVSLSFTVGREERRKRLILAKMNLKPPRYTTMPDDVDWTNVWPSAHSFKYSVVPLPVRQGQIKSKTEAAGDGLPPVKYANLELMKIPNFLHLTPNHIRKHCIAMKKYTTPWPKDLDTDEAVSKQFPFEKVTSDYCFSGPSIRDKRARIVKIKFPLKSLKMDAHGEDKFLKLVGDRYNPETGVVSMQMDRCPLKSQNLDYLMYQVTALFFESMNEEPWEKQMTEEDMLQNIWGSELGRKSLEVLLSKDPDLKEEEGATELRDLVGKRTEELKQELVTRTEAKPVTEKVYNYKIASEQLLNGKKDKSDMDNYKEAVKKLFNLGKRTNQPIVNE